MSTDYAVVSVSEDPICYWKEALLLKELVSVLLFPSSSLLSLRGASLAFSVSGAPPSQHGD